MIEFVSKPITTEDFSELPPIRTYKRQNEPAVVTGEEALQHYFADFSGELQADDTDNYQMLITADDYYKLYINGEYVGQGPRPAYTTRYNYNRYDISNYIKPGKNNICVRVYYQGVINRTWVSGDNRMMLLADIFKDEKHCAGTEIFTQCHKINGYIKSSLTTQGHNTQFVENYDFNLPNEARAVLPYPYEYTFHNEPSPALEIEYFTPKLCKLGDNDYFADLGREIVGSLMLDIVGTLNQKITIQQAEELNSDGTLKCPLRCHCSYETQLTLSGNDDTYNEYDYKGFRYLRVFSESDFELSSLKIAVRHHPFKQIIDLETDNELLKRIWTLCIDTAKYATQELFLDCPTREKGEYFGDFAVSGLAHLYATGDTQMYKHALYDFADTSDVHIGLMAVGSCSFMQEIADYSLLFPVVLYNYYKYSADIGTVRELLPVSLDMLRYFMQFAREDGLLYNMCDKWNLVDWPPNLRDNYDAPNDNPRNICHNVLNAFYIGAHIYHDKLADLVGEQKLGMANSLTKAFNNAFFKSELGLYTDTAESCHSAIHSNVLPLFYGFAPQNAKENIVNQIQEKGLCCGVYFSYFVLKALTQAGRRDIALSLILDSRYWANMLSEGATTTFEAWGKEQKNNCSLCHPWASAPLIVLAEDFPEMIKKYN